MCTKDWYLYVYLTHDRLSLTNNGIPITVESGQNVDKILHKVVRTNGCIAIVKSKRKLGVQRTI